MKSLIKLVRGISNQEHIVLIKIFINLNYYIQILTGKCKSQNLHMTLEFVV